MGNMCCVYLNHNVHYAKNCCPFLYIEILWYETMQDSLILYVCVLFPLLSG